MESKRTSPISPEDFARMDVVERIRAIDAAHGEKALLLSSMQRTSSVLMHLIHRARAKTVILFVDTQFHFPETLALRDEFMERFGLNITTVYPELTPEEQERKYGAKLYNYVDSQPECCNMRKEKPFLKHAWEIGTEALLNGLMREEGGNRGKISPIGYDPRLNSIVYRPIFDWTEEQVDAYNKEHDVPVNALHFQSYPSIGCMPCTTPVAPGESKRAGRWRHLRVENGAQPQYCNINFSDLGEGI